MTQHSDYMSLKLQWMLIDHNLINPMCESFYVADEL